jgi:hypothetical protein
MEDILIGNTGSGISYQPYAGAAVKRQRDCSTIEMI